MSSASAPMSVPALGGPSLAPARTTGLAVRARERAALAGVVLVGALLRLWHLGRDDFWTDELATLHYASTLGTSYQDTHPPLYYVLMHFWLMVAPVNEVTVRMPSVILGTAAIVLVHHFAAALYGRPTALVAATLLALSTIQLQFSQEGRMYALLTLAAVASSWSLFRLMARPTRASALAFLFSAILLVNSHIFGLVVLFTYNVMMLCAMLFVRQPTVRSLATWALMQVAIVGTIVPWLTYLYLHPGIERVNWIPPATAVALYDIFKELAFDSDAILALLGVMALYGCIPLPTRSGRLRVGLDDRVAGPLLLLLLLLPALLAFVISTLVMPILMTRYLIGCAVPLSILAARGVTRLRPHVLCWGVTGAILVLAATRVYAYVEAPHKLPWQELARTLAPRVADSDLLVFEGFSSDAFDFYAARHRVLGGVERYWLRPDGRRVPADAEAQLTQALAGRERFWLIQGGSREDEQRLNQYVRRTFQMRDQVTLPGVRARLFEMHPQASEMSGLVRPA